MTPELISVIQTLNDNIQHIKKLHSDRYVENTKLQEEITKLLTEIEKKKVNTDN
jgi:hypothetical protein